MKKEYRKSAPLTEEDFDKVIKKLEGNSKNWETVLSIRDMYLYGKNLKYVCERYNIPRRTMQQRLSKVGITYMRLKNGFIAREMGKGFTIDNIRNRLGMSTRNHLNKLMWEKVRGDITPSKRWKILKRDNFRCVLCGADATDRKLHIDHIVPVSEGGLSKIENLRVLCETCNYGRTTDLKDKHNQNNLNGEND